MFKKKTQKCENTQNEETSLFSKLESVEKIVEAKAVLARPEKTIKKPLSRKRQMTITPPSFPTKGLGNQMKIAEAIGRYLESEFSKPLEMGLESCKKTTRDKKNMIISFEFSGFRFTHRTQVETIVSRLEKELQFELRPYRGRFEAYIQSQGKYNGQVSTVLIKLTLLLRPFNKESHLRM